MFFLIPHTEGKAEVNVGSPQCKICLDSEIQEGAKSPMLYFALSQWESSGGHALPGVQEETNIPIF